MPNLGSLDLENGLVFWSKAHGWLCPDVFDQYLEKHKAARAKFRSRNPKYHVEQEARNHEKNKAKRSAYYANNRELVIARTNEWAKNNPERKKAISRKGYKKRINTNEAFRLRVNIGNRINCAIRRGGINSKKSTLDMIGMSGAELKKYIESMFLPGMSWSNWSPTGWHIDHIIPLSFAKNESELKALCHYTNLRPLWAIDNMKKSNKIDDIASAEKAIQAIQQRQQVVQAQQQAGIQPGQAPAPEQAPQPQAAI